MIGRDYVHAMASGQSEWSICHSSNHRRSIQEELEINIAALQKRNRKIACGEQSAARVFRQLITVDVDGQEASRRGRVRARKIQGQAWKKYLYQHRRRDHHREGLPQLSTGRSS